MRGWGAGSGEEPHLRIIGVLTIRMTRMKPTGESACVMNVAYAGRIAAKSTRLRYCNIHRSLCRATASRPTYSSEKIATQTRSIMSHPGQAARLWIVCVMSVMTETAKVIIIIIDHVSILP